MKKLHFLMVAVMLAAVIRTNAQFLAGFHQSNIPFVGIGYEIEDRFLPEVRLGTDNYFEDLSFEGVITYQILNTDDFELYAGVGGRVNSLAGFIVPLGLNVYPFAIKKFGFHIELTPIIGEEDILRGSWGIRYRFKKE